MHLKTIFLYLSQASVLIPIFIGFRHIKALTGPYKLLFYFFVVTALFEIQSEIARKVYHNNMPGQHAFTIVEFVALSAVYYMLLQKNSRYRYLIGFNVIVFVGVAIANIVSTGITTPNDMSHGYSSFFLIVYALGYFYYLFRVDDTRYMWEYPMFWFCTGTLISFAGSGWKILSN